MKVLFLVRSTLYKVYGGDTVQIVSTAKYLERLGVSVDIQLSNAKIDYSQYDLLHAFNIIRPADILTHVKKSRLPYVLSTIFIDFNEYQKHNKGTVATFSKFFSSDQIEYLKAVARWVKNGEAIQSRSYLFQGHKKSIRSLVAGAARLLPNSKSEYERFYKHYRIQKPYTVIYNGIDTEVFHDSNNEASLHDPLKVLCVARFEGNKNQINLIKALNNTPFKVKLIGKPALNHMPYYRACRQAAADNITFEDFMPHDKLIKEYRSAKVHILPSWNETCGLSSLEASYYNCNIVITNKGDTVEYFGKHAWYCDPADPESIYRAVLQASQAPMENKLYEKIKSIYNWEKAAADTLAVYEEVMGENNNNGVMVKNK